MSDTLLDDFRASLADGLANRTLNSCYRWAQKRRIIQDVITNEPAPYSARLHPWVVGMHDSKAPFNYSMKGAQLGVTEVIINRALYSIDKLKKDVLYVLPTSTTAADFSKARFGGALSLSPYLKGMFDSTDAVGIKQAGANTLYIRGSRGDSNLVSIPVSDLILDEVDRMEQKAIWLALERLSGKIVKSVWGISTPTIPNYGIHKLYQSTTQEHFMFPCPKCGVWTELVFPDCLEIRGEHVTDIRCKESFLKCKECKQKLEHEDKPNFLSKAKWVSTDGSSNPEVRGFYINQLYSFTITPEELAVAHFRGIGDELAEKEFFNSKLGLPFISHGAKVDDGMIDRAVERGGHSMDEERPRYADRIITMGIDRGKWNYAEITEWFYNDIGYDLNAKAIAKVLYVMKFLEEDFDRVVDELMREWQVQACVLDADPGPNEARRFARRFPGHVWLCRYRRGQVAKEISVSEEDGGAPIATVDRSNWLSASLGRFKTNPSRILLPRDIPLEYREHMKALTSTYVRDENDEPRLDFVKTDPDHFAHARTYSEIALPLCAAGSSGYDIKKFL